MVISRRRLSEDGEECNKMKTTRARSAERAEIKICEVLVAIVIVLSPYWQSVDQISLYN